MNRMVRSQNEEQLSQHSRYTYDALGRRLKQQVHSTDGTPTHYYGWDGNRLIHTKRLQDGDDTRHLEHTVYEPGSFTPLVRLSTTASGDPQGTPHLLVQAMAAGLPANGQGSDDPGDDPSDAQGLAMMQSMLSAMPRAMQQEAARHLRHAMEHGLPANAVAMPGEQAESTTRMLSGMQATLQAQEKAQQARIAIHHYHCDHLGTPLALTDRDGCVVWAVKLDAWGNVQQEYNPQGIHQAIRLPGQHHDRETGLYYNRHRYYDPVVGSYINQDPIGLRGGANNSTYLANPLSRIDPLGLWSTDAHNYFIDEFFKNQPSPIRDIIKEGSQYADKIKFQGAEFAFMHAMSSEKMDAKESQKLMCEYIKSKTDEAKNAYEKGSGSYWFLLGMALHPVMDSTSPAHEGFQRWGGIFKDGNKHGEMPGILEGLDTAKNSYHSMRTLKKMQNAMNGNLSSCGC